MGNFCNTHKYHSMDSKIQPCNLVIPGTNELNIEVLKMICIKINCSPTSNLYFSLMDNKLCRKVCRAVLPVISQNNVMRKVDLYADS